MNDAPGASGPISVSRARRRHGARLHANPRLRHVVLSAGRSRRADPADTGWSLAADRRRSVDRSACSGLSAPLVGRFVDRFGGRPVLAFGSICFALGLAGVGLSTKSSSTGSPGAWWGSEWLPDSTMRPFRRSGGGTGRRRGPLITTVTLWGGFASTLCWPLSAYLVVGCRLALDLPDLCGDPSGGRAAAPCVADAVERSCRRSECRRQRTNPTANRGPPRAVRADRSQL